MNNHKEVRLNELVFEKGTLTPIFNSAIIEPCYSIGLLGQTIENYDLIIDHSIPPVYALEDYGEIKFYFHPVEFIIKKDQIKFILESQLSNGNCSSYDISRFTTGEIDVFFNPTCHKRSDRLSVIDDIKDTMHHAWLHYDE